MEILGCIYVCVWGHATFNGKSSVDAKIWVARQKQNTNRTQNAHKSHTNRAQTAHKTRLRERRQTSEKRPLKKEGY